ncbi:MAG: hypothetical protein LWW94_05930, partial [Candidatus Desulfofervidaceae bacterium]|nr:hypothetical protein [Candidatus Desulfofervidaceae bacterium]
RSRPSPAGGLAASLDLARFGAIFFLRPEGKISFSLPPFNFSFLPGPSAVKGKPEGRSLPKGQVGTSVASEDP